MWLKIVLLALQIVHGVLSWLERQKWKAEGRAEAYAEADEARKERIAQANAARDDYDAISMSNDPLNRDRK